jgi:hypothetical protein
MTSTLQHLRQFLRAQKKSSFFYVPESAITAKTTAARRNGLTFAGKSFYANSILS